MGKRRKARELALQLLYQLDVQGEGEPGPHLDEFWARHPVDREAREFAEALVRGTKQPRGEDRRADLAVRRALGARAHGGGGPQHPPRRAIFELLWAADVPPKVAINEALEVAKKFSTQESSRFINGILDRIHKEHAPAS